MFSLNKVTLIGNVGKDPEVRRLNNGNQVVSFSLATSKQWRDKSSGERKERTEWHNVVVFNENLAKIAEQYVSKGSRVYIEGELQTRKWTDKEGQDRYTTEVVLQAFHGELGLLSASNKPSEDGRDPAQDEPRGSMKVTSGRAKQPELADDEIPF